MGEAHAQNRGLVANVSIVIIDWSDSSFSFVLYLGCVQCECT